VIAIDHLPSLLPLESSEDYGSQLLKHLLDLADESDPVWQGALDVFEAKTRELR
jgi:saccharopine dehydrogenase (NAD+, L-lysine-forming)